MSNNSSDRPMNPFESFAKDANNCKTPESAGKKRRPTNALRPKPLPPIVMPSLFDTIGVEI